MGRLFLSFRTFRFVCCTETRLVHFRNNGKVFSKSVMKRLRQDLGLTLPGDLRVVLAAAERLRPGVYSYVSAAAGADLRLPEPDYATHVAESF